MTCQAQVALAAYVLVAVVTFGHSASEFVAAQDREETACNATAKEAADRAYCSIRNDSEVAPIGALVSAALWPLYWSWEAFDAVR